MDNNSLDNNLQYVLFCDSVISFIYPLPPLRPQQKQEQRARVSNLYLR